MLRRAVVTGASRGIGQAVAERLRGEGWFVVNLDRVPPEAEPVEGETWVEADLSTATAVAAAAAAVLADGPVHALVNNAGIALAGSLDTLSAADIDRSVAINQRAPALLAQALVPSMRSAGGGRIVNIASRAHLGKTLRTAYAGTKGALISMTRVWALELAADGITCNAIAPGPVRTELFDKVNPPDMPRTRAIAEAVPVGRLGLPRDVANACAFFLDERSDFITGQVLYVCGGVTLARGGS